jgi:hypothetical protein
VESISVSADYPSGGSYFGFPSPSAEVTFFENGDCVSENQWLKKSNMTKMIFWQLHTNYWGLSKKDFDLTINIHTNGFALAITGKNSLEIALPFFEKYLENRKKAPTSNIS